MKKVYQPAIIFIFLVQFVMAASIKDNQVPNSKIKMLNGEYAKLSDFNEDGPVIINFWTTWWPFCERQLAYLDQLSSNFSETGLKVLAVNVNKPQILNQVRPYINKRKYKFDVSVDPRGKLAKQFGVKGFPTLFLVDKDGTIIHVSDGYEDGQENSYLEELKKYLESKNISYADFQYKKQLDNKKDAVIDIDF